MKIISREQALAQGLTRYFTGEPCSRGHIAERQTSNTLCHECNRLRYHEAKQHKATARFHQLGEVFKAQAKLEVSLDSHEMDKARSVLRLLAGRYGDKVVSQCARYALELHDGSKAEV